MTLTKKLVKEVIIELEKLGWTCKISFGGTGVFIYGNPDNPPSNCFEDSIDFS